MAQDPLTDKLVKANGDLGKLCEFIASRQALPTADDAREAARDLAAASDRFDEHLRVLVQACGAELAPSYRPAAQATGSGALDASRLGRFAQFVRDLDAWLVAQPGPTTDPDGIEALRTMQSYLGYLRTTAAGLAPGPGPATAGGPPPGTPGDPPSPASQPVAPSPDGAPHQLVLDDTDEHPMVHELQHRMEPTPACEAQVDRFLAAWGIEYSYYHRKKLLERLVRWITSAPEGHVLVLKVKTAEEPYEPYPSYVSRDVLSAGAGVPDPDPDAEDR